MAKKKKITEHEVLVTIHATMNFKMKNLVCPAFRSPDIHEKKCLGLFFMNNNLQVHLEQEVKCMI